MRTGVVLPTFRDTARRRVRRRDRGGRGRGGRAVLLRPHLAAWASPSARPWRPSPSSARWPRSSARHGRTGEGPFLGTLVARVGLAPNAVLAAQFAALERLAPGRVIAGLGTGDRLSEEENRAYGIPFPPAAERRAQLVELGRELRGRRAHGLGRRRDGRAHRGGAGRGCRPQRVGRRPGAGGRAGLGPRRRGGDVGRAAAHRVAAAWPRRVRGPARRPAPPGSCSAGRSTSTRWSPPRRAAGRRARRRGGAEPGRRLPRWSSAGSTGCRPTSSPPSTTSRRRRGEPAGTSSTSASATPTCPRPTWRSTSWPRPPTTRATTATRPRAASPSCAAPSPTSTGASSASSSTPRPRW